jgi:hypothetical protein
MTSEEFQLKKIALLVKGIFASAILVFSLAAIIYTSNPAYANDYPPTLQDSGKYKFQYATGVDKEGSFYWHLMAYNSETGKFKIYYWNRESQAWTENFNGKDLPSLP